MKAKKLLKRIKSKLKTVKRKVPKNKVTMKAKKLVKRIKSKLKTVKRNVSNNKKP